MQPTDHPARLLFYISVRIEVLGPAPPPPLRILCLDGIPLNMPGSAAYILSGHLKWHSRGFLGLSEGALSSLFKGAQA